MAILNSQMVILLVSEGSQSVAVRKNHSFGFAEVRTKVSPSAALGDIATQKHVRNGDEMRIKAGHI